jgi:UDP-GlcNAc:undecaprenyl-phosphate GlcNAc-1-phosphate transferase
MRCFMGDAGSTLLGFLLACLSIGVSQAEGSGISPTTILWVVAIPLFELLWTTMRRVLKGQSPFKPDRGHFHHKLLDAGFGVRGAFLVLICLGVMLSAGGIAIQYYGVPDSMSFALWLASGVATVVLMYNAKILWYVLPEKFRRVRPIEFEPG